MSFTRPTNVDAHRYNAAQMRQKTEFMFRFLDELSTEPFYSLEAVLSTDKPSVVTKDGLVVVLEGIAPEGCDYLNFHEEFEFSLFFQEYKNFFSSTYPLLLEHHKSVMKFLSLMDEIQGRIGSSLLLPNHFTEQYQAQYGTVGHTGSFSFGHSAVLIRGSLLHIERFDYADTVRPYLSRETETRLLSSIPDYHETFRVNKLEWSKFQTIEELNRFFDQNQCWDELLKGLFPDY